MRSRERGIGNMAFIAVLVLLVVAAALAFVKNDDAANFQGRLAKAQADIKTKDDQLFKVREAYDAWVEVAGLAMPELVRNEDNYPEGATIKTKVRTWMMEQINIITQKSQAKVAGRQYQIDRASNVVRVTEGEPATVVLFGSPFVQDTITFQGFVAPLGEQFRYAAKAVEDNNTLFETEYKNYQSRMTQFQTRQTEMQGQYASDVSAKAGLYDTEKQRADSMQDQVNKLTAEIDAKSADLQARITAFDKDKRTYERTIQAQNDRFLSEKKKMEIALKEDPKDGEVLVADQRKGLVFIDRGRNFRVAPDMKFRVWRLGKGNVREDVAEVEVIEVDDTRSTCRILKWFNTRVPVAQGMSISNPFYDPHKKLRIHIYGNLRYYPSDLAKRRLAESGCTVSDRLDDTVNVVVLGEPAVDLGTEAGTPEEAAAAEERAKAQRAARVREVMETAATLGAVVVTEEVLRTFIEY
jgi:hypothetical protein